jgi:hypothetical protein
MDYDEEKRQRMLQYLEMLATPVDYDQLCEEGVLERVSKKKFKVPDVNRLPAHVRLRINCEMGPDNVVEFGKTEKTASKLLKRLKLRLQPLS